MFRRRIFNRTTFPQSHRLTATHRAHGSRQWYRIENFIGTSPDLTAVSVYIYDEIGMWGVTAADFVRDLQSINATVINLHINSPGGDVFDGIAIYNAIKSHPAAVTVYIDGVAASAASFIAQAGDSVRIARNAQMMIHEAMGLCMGTAAEMIEMAALLDKSSDNIADIYAQKAGGTVKQWRKQMQAGDTWYVGAEAVTAGLADEVYEPDEALTNTATAPSTPPTTPVLNQAPAVVVEPPAASDAPEPAAPAATVIEPEPEPKPEPLPELPFNADVFRGAVTAASTLPFDAGHFRSLMTSVATDAPAERQPVAATPPKPAPVTAPAPPPEPPPPFDLGHFRNLMAAVASDAPAERRLATPTPPPEPAAPAPPPVPPPEPELTLADVLRAAVANVAVDAPAPPAPTIPDPAPAEPVFPPINKTVFEQALREAKL